MKKTIKYIAAVLLLLFVASCDKDVERNEAIADGYLTLNSRVIYQPGETRYRVEFKGKDIAKESFSRNETEGELKVYALDADTPELTTQYNIEERGNSIQLIKLPGKTIQLYAESDYIAFSATLALFENYKVVLNSQEIMQGINYVKSDALAGTLEFIKEGEADPVSTIEDFKAKAGDNLILLQSSDTDFIQLAGGSDDEPAPETDSFSKVRFFYAPVGKLNVDSIRLDFMASEMWQSEADEEYASVIVKKGELSPYREFDVTLYKDEYGTPPSFLINIYDAKTQELIEGGFTSWRTQFELPSKKGDEFKTSHKFITYQITTPRYKPKIVEGLSEKWETETPAE